VVSNKEKKVPKNPSWSQLQSRLLTLNKDDLLKVIQDLYQLNTDNKVFLNSHLGMEDPEILAQPYRKIIKQVFNPDRGFPNLSLRSARKALNDFGKANANSEAIVDMMLYYVEQGVICTNEYGDINEAFYNSVEGVFEDAIALIKKTGNPELIEAFRLRIKRIVANTSGIGWGFHDFISDVYNTQYPPED
jgi:hypothetical protein